MPVLEVGQSHLRYDAAGDGDALVFAHGVGGNRVSWFNQVPCFSKSHRVIAFDHRGFGGSSDIEGVGRTAYVDDLLALLDSLDVEKAILVGQSMGGGTCAAFSCRHPDRVRGLVIADSLSGVRVPEPLATTIAQTREANRGLSQAERVLGPAMRNSDPEHALLYLQLATFNSVNVATVKGVMPEWSPEGLVASGLPVLFVVGEEDILFPPSQVAAVQALTRGSTLRIIPGAGHSAYFEQPEEFNRILAEFIATLST